MHDVDMDVIIAPSHEKVIEIMTFIIGSGLTLKLGPTK